MDASKLLILGGAAAALYYVMKQSTDAAAASGTPTTVAQSSSGGATVVNTTVNNPAPVAPVVSPTNPIANAQGVTAPPATGMTYPAPAQTAQIPNVAIEMMPPVNYQQPAVYSSPYVTPPTSGYPVAAPTVQPGQVPVANASPANMTVTPPQTNYYPNYIPYTGGAYVMMQSPPGL